MLLVAFPELPPNCTAKLLPFGTIKQAQRVNDLLAQGWRISCLLEPEDSRPNMMLLYKEPGTPRIEDIENDEAEVEDEEDDEEEDEAEAEAEDEDDEDEEADDVDSIDDDEEEEP